LGAVFCACSADLNVFLQALVFALDVAFSGFDRAETTKPIDLSPPKRLMRSLANRYPQKRKEP
jgi:hypothetical protein